MQNLLFFEEFFLFRFFWKNFFFNPNPLTQNKSGNTEIKESKYEEKMNAARTKQNKTKRRGGEEEDEIQV